MIARRHHAIATRSLCSAAVAAALVASLPARADDPGELELEIDPCVEVDAERLRDLVRIELTDADIAAEVSCDDRGILIRIDGTPVRRVDPGPEPGGRERVIALVLVELHQTESAPPADPTAPVLAPGAAVTSQAPAVVEPPVDARSRDPALDRAFVSSTAHTLPDGAWALSSRELLFVSAAYGFTDRLQLSVHGLPMERGAVASELKASVLRVDRLHLALAGTAFYNFDDADGLVFGGLITSLCIDRDCDSLLSAAAHGGKASDETGLAGYFAGSAIVSVLPPFKLVSEAMLLVPGRSMSFLAGGRWIYGRLGVDFGVAALVDASSDSGPMPWLGVVWRQL